jgi:lysophospholipase L1-like esterase
MLGFMSRRNARSRNNSDSARVGALKLSLLGLTAVVVVSLVIFALTAVKRTDPSVAAAPMPTMGTPRVERAQFGSDDRPQGRPLRVLYIGTSVTIGFFASDEAHKWTSIVSAALTQSGPIENVPVVRLPQAAGATTKISSYDPAAIPKDLDVIVVELVTNDVNTTKIADFSAQMTILLDALQQGSPNANVLCLGAWHARPGTYDNIERDQCVARGAKFSTLTDIKSKPGVAGPAGLATFYGESDAFHPNDVGEAAIAAEVLRRFSKFLPPQR